MFRPCPDGFDPPQLGSVECELHPDGQLNQGTDDRNVDEEVKAAESMQLQHLGGHRVFVDVERTHLITRLEDVVTYDRKRSIFTKLLFVTGIFIGQGKLFINNLQKECLFFYRIYK